MLTKYVSNFKSKKTITAKTLEELEKLIDGFIEDNGEVKEIKKYCYGRVYYAELIV